MRICPASNRCQASALFQRPTNASLRSPTPVGTAMKSRQADPACNLDVQKNETELSPGIFLRCPLAWIRQTEDKKLWSDCPSSPLLSGHHSLPVALDSDNNCSPLQSV